MGARTRKLAPNWEPAPDRLHDYVINSRSRSLSSPFVNLLTLYCLLVLITATPFVSLQPLDAKETPGKAGKAGGGVWTSTTGRANSERVGLEYESGESTNRPQNRSNTMGTRAQYPSFLDPYLFFNRRPGPTIANSWYSIVPPSDAKKEKPGSTTTTTTTTTLSPVILVPGYGGSRLEAKIEDKKQVKHYFCERKSDWRNIWIDLKLMLPYIIDCLIDEFRLEFEPLTNTTHNTQGVDIRVGNPNDLSTVEYLTDIRLSSFGYFAAIIRKLSQAYGYERNVNIRGAPYDFRKAPNELGDHFDQLKVTCEKMFAQSRGQPVSFICHSMGCNNVLYFLQRQSKDWKDKHVKRVISLAAPWAGAMQAVRATAFGDNLGMPYLFDESELKIVQQSVPSTMYLFPNERVFKDDPLIKTNMRPALLSNEIDDTAAAPQNKTSTLVESEVFTAHDFRPFFERIQHPNGYLMWLNTKDLLRSLEAPGVEMYCLYGRGHSTLARMEFDGEFPGSKERDIYDDGDGTVSVQSSATICQTWSKEQTQPVNLKPFYANHIEMIKDADVLSAIEEIMNPISHAATNN